ncbi:hypothetical protein KLP40_19255 [Hymenobacter sp. NST-14]|uniref:hypothetical protein n=1 Tax=Hymenobacter piscis TaxID=2839984 RepID=UPI001C030D8A|nr:hypothetical protein [Hymenobacter piscis]MBT9395313.1 hypothetical protein [Hymenobacter piscis]
MTDPTVPALPPSSVVDLLTQRIRQREEPAVVLMTPEAIRERLGRVLGEQLRTRDPRRRRTLAHFVYALMAVPELPNAALAEAAGITAQAAQRVVDGLVRAGLLRVHYHKNVRYQGLSLAGEALALRAAQGQPENSRHHL